MSKQYKIREKANPKHVISCDWQNASELVNHGFWTWAEGDGGKEFRTAQADAKKNNPKTEGFDHLGTPPETADDDDEDEPAPAPVVTIADVAATVVDTGETLEDMTREELFAHAESLGLTVDKRFGTKNLISAIRAAQGAAE